MHRGRSLTLIALFAALTITAAEAMRSVGGNYFTDAQPHGLSFEYDRFDAGVVEDPLQTVVRCTFPFTNASSQTITVKEVKSSCGCTVVADHQRSYSPGEKGVIEADLHLTSGTRAVTLLVYSDSARTPQALSLRGTFKPPVQATCVPSQLRLPRNRPLPASVQLELFVLHTEPLDASLSQVLLGGEAVPAAVRDRSTTDRRSGKGYYCTRMEVVLEVPAGEKLPDSALLIRFTPSTVPEISVPVHLTRVWGD